MWLVGMSGTNDIAVVVVVDVHINENEMSAPGFSTIQFSYSFSFQLSADSLRFMALTMMMANSDDGSLCINNWGIVFSTVFFCILRNLAWTKPCSHHNSLLSLHVWYGFNGYYPFGRYFLLFIIGFIGFRRLAPRIASKMVKNDNVVCVSHIAPFELRRTSTISQWRDGARDI